MPSFPINHQSISLAVAGGLASCLSLATALPARAQNLSYPAPGVICDGSAKLCYDKTAYPSPSQVLPTANGPSKRR